MFQTKVVEKIKTHILCMFTAFFQKLCHLWDNLEKYGTTRQATDGNIMWYMCIACWITKAIDTCWKYVILICFAMATVVMRTHLSIMFIYIYILPVLLCGKSAVTRSWFPWILNYWLPFIKTASTQTDIATRLLDYRWLWSPRIKTENSVSYCLT